MTPLTNASCADGTRSSVLETWTSKTKIVQDDHSSVMTDVRKKEWKPIHEELHLDAEGEVKKPDKWAPHELTEEQQRCRLQFCSSLMIKNENYPFLDRVIACPTHSPDLTPTDFHLYKHLDGFLKEKNVSNESATVARVMKPIAEEEIENLLLKMELTSEGTVRLVTYFYDGV
ncbi:unnamed protein product [Heligmosomoides polygyrus]|uniref:RING-type domain-containing protein n=1 Tax=Heligmosomoides polygyrus TaxID=6339 RepID=A0A183FRQ3_HELPZ|nr:unnamed protein product [Heligmosomoides polygyrus]